MPARAGLEAQLEAAPFSAEIAKTLTEKTKQLRECYSALKSYKTDQGDVGGLETALRNAVQAAEAFKEVKNYAVRHCSSSQTSKKARKSTAEPAEASKGKAKGE